MISEQRGRYGNVAAVCVPIKLSEYDQLFNTKATLVNTINRFDI